MAFTLTFRALAADVTAPTTTASLSPSSPNGNLNWYVTPVGVTLNATDLESGVKEINYKVDAGAWQKVEFTDSVNLAPNASMEEIDAANTPIIKDWSATVTDANTTYTRDTSMYLTDYATTSAKIVTTGTGWHGVNNQNNYAVVAPLSNMTASAWVKTDAVAESAYFKVYIVSQDLNGLLTYTYLTQSTFVSATAEWTKLNATFVVSDPLAIGIYIDIGLTGTGTMWIDAVTISSTNTNTAAPFTVGTDGSHTVEYYSTDVAGNTETHSCTSNPKVKCITFKIDQTPPSNWHDSGAIRGFFGSDHEVYVYTTVEDPTSGLSVFTDKYMYHTETQSGFGKYSNLLNCSSTWQPNQWMFLITPPFSPGAHSAYLITPKTDFCNSNWKICKIVRFYAEDLAGNTTTKDYCINGPWIKFTGGGTVRANGGIDMVAEAEGDNTDGLIETGNTLVGFFTTSRDWWLADSPSPVAYDYDKWQSVVAPSPTTVSGLNTQSGVFKINSNFEITTAAIPSGYGTATFSQIVFINGDLKISKNITVANGSTALFIVKGKVEVAKTVTSISAAIFTDGQFYTAYNITEGESSGNLSLKGVFVADQFNFQRTLQGANNADNPSETITFEPKYSINLAQYLGVNSVKWVSSD